MKYKSIFNAVGAVAVAVVLLMGCEAFLQMPGGPPFTDSRDGKTYKTVNVGGKTWMAENLNFAAEGSKCYKNDPAYCEKYGRLYDWETALKACPAGFHLPSDDEWKALTDAVDGGVRDADGKVVGIGKKLKSAEGWSSGGNGADYYGFSALPGGSGNLYGGFGGAGEQGYWWSATEENAHDAWARYMYYNNGLVDRRDRDKPFLFSVRCVQDEAFLQMSEAGPSVSQMPVAGPSVSTFTDSRDGKTYKSVNVGGKTWMAENLNFAAEGSKCYNNDPAYCEKYGRLYDWETALEACPAGFHLPSDDEWGALGEAVRVNWKELRSAEGWRGGGNGTDDYGFSALPGGIHTYEWGFSGAGENGEWWSATENGSGGAYSRKMQYDGYESMYRTSGHRLESFLMSVRCVQD